MYTKENVLRAFVGECQARMRYEMAASEAKKQKLPILQKIFQFTADQEKEHAEIFYKYLREVFKEESISIEGEYPITIRKDLSYVLGKAAEHEDKEATVIYVDFSKEAKKEGYLDIASSFMMIADIEKFHQQRFLKYKQVLDSGMLFVGEVTQMWMCLNCGFIYEGSKAPETCPVCKHEQGYFIHLEEAPFTK